MTTDGLDPFLTARLDEDELALGCPPNLNLRALPGDPILTVAVCSPGCDLTRRLADIGAKRAILAAYRSAVSRREAERADFSAWAAGEASRERPEFPGEDPALIPGLELAMRILAGA